MNTFDQQRRTRMQQSRLEQDMKLIEEPVVAVEQRNQWTQRDQATERVTMEQNVPVEAAKFGETNISKMKDEERLQSNSDSMRLSIKCRIAELSREYRAAAGGNSAFKKILDRVDAYTKLDASAVKASDIQKEQRAMEEIKSELMGFIQTLIVKTEKQTITEEENELMQKAYRLFGFFEGQKNGYLERPSSGSKQIKAVGPDAFAVAPMETIKDASSLPLFSHEPCVSDVRQGYLGDCYLLASLAAIVSQNPEAIKECMRDNNDGTVTVRFFEKSAEGAFSPVYITVDKKIPMSQSSDLYAHDCIWVQMLERAYAASNIHGNINDGSDSWAASTTEELEQMAANDTELQNFDSLTLEQKKNIMKTKSKNLFDVKTAGDDPHGEVIDIRLRQSMKPRYSSIAAGYSGDFIRVLLGEKYQKKKFTPKNDMKNRDRYADSFGMLVEASKPQTYPNDEGTSAVKIALFAKGIITSFLPFPDPKFKKGSPERDAYDAQKLVINHMNMLYNCILNELNKLDEAQQGEAEKEVNMTRDFQPLLDRAMSEYRQRRGDSQLENAQKVIDYFKEQLSQKGSMFSRFKALSGEYDEYHEKLYSQISEAIESGKIVTFDTDKMEDTRNKGLNGESTGIGIVGTHAYSIMGTQTKIVGEKTYKFIVARNPWAKRARQYYEKDGNITYREQDKGNQGIFLIELSDFSKFTDNVFING